MIKRTLKLYFTSWWLPALVYMCLLAAFAIATVSRWQPLAAWSNALFGVVALAFLGLIAAAMWNCIKQRWGTGIIGFFLVFVCGAASLFAFGFLMFATMFGPSEDGFADHLTIPTGIALAEPEKDASSEDTVGSTKGTDAMQDAVHQALTIAGGEDATFAPAMPLLRRAATIHGQLFREYLAASPDWHVFMEHCNTFAARRWSYQGEPRDTLHGYISEFGGTTRFQTRCLICLDRQQWSSYAVQHVAEGTTPVTPEMSQDNALHESRLMIECGGVWVEIFEQSATPERRISKATVATLEQEFAEFEQDPAAALASAQARSRALAVRLAGKDDQPFRLLVGMQPGMYGVAYSLNPGEPGVVYLKAYEVTQGTPLSADALASKSKARLTWSSDPAERFGDKAGFTIYEGDWGKPYAARFEVWFKPNAAKRERKLAERVYKIEGWQR